MIAIVSGSARRALIGDGERWSAIDADDLVNPVVWHGRDLRAAFRDATDLEFIHGVSIEEVRQRLVEACDRAAALHLSLLGLDPSLSDETRRAALTELEDLVVRGAGEFVRAVLFARPLSDSHDIAGALRLGEGAGARAIYAELARSQPHVRAVFEAWEAIPDAFFLGVARRDCRARLVRGGWFYRLGMAMAERADERPMAVLARMKGDSNLRDVRELPSITETWLQRLTSPAHVEKAPEPTWVRERLAIIIQQVPLHLAEQFQGLLNADTRKEIAVEAAARMWQRYSAAPSEVWDDDFAYKWAVWRSREYLQGRDSQTGRIDYAAHPASTPPVSEPPDPSPGPEAIAEAREILQRAIAEIGRLRPEHVREAMTRYLMRSHDDAVEYLSKSRGMTRDNAVRFIDRYRRSVQKALESAATPGKPGDGREGTVMMMSPGQRVSHVEFGEGVIVGEALDGFVRVFFARGERQVPLASLKDRASRSDRMLEGVAADPERSRRAWLAVEAHALPLMDSASSLTAAKVDLLPHQIVLTHRVAIASPRRFLVADEVGLGKTIETALILRELASRGELKRALMVVPAGLVNNWHRELNDVFRLDFEVFGSEGDVTDRKTNAFAKHDRLIASVDTLKQERRIRRLLEAPRWDLVVFDEAHHLTASRTGKKVTKTENYKLAEALKGHTRDLLLLSATPHQGDHFRFWMLVQLLNPTLFNSPDEMVENRHRLNEVVFRRTKADACRADGAPLFARREVHTDSFTMTDAEAAFYDELLKYLQDGFALAKREGGKGRALGFVMAIFQKIAASSFAAVRATLRRRLLALTVHEAVLRDRNLDIDGRQKLYDEARALIREDYGLGSDLAASNQVDRILADWKAQVIEQVEEAAAERAADTYGVESGQAGAEDLVARAVSLALPEERLRIGDLIGRFPSARETKVARLLEALGQLWKENAAEKVVVFATYLSTVDMLGREIEGAFPGKGVAVLRGGDHGAKLAAERRFRSKDGPRVLVCTAAGREGINLQFARVLFNFDLPWNPMDVEQRIGRIHRYGQRDTAQVYNLILSDTIEGRIFLLLDEKLQEIARALGKVDERGNITEDLRTQILGQLSERIRYDDLYQKAISDPELRRTEQEIKDALTSAREARQVVFSLFQDLEGFNLDDYKPLADTAGSIERMVRYFGAATADAGKTLATTGPGRFEVRDGSGAPLLRFTTDRDLAREDDSLDLFGLDHPLMQEALRRWREIAPESLGLAVRAGDDPAGVLTAWLVEAHGPRGERSAAVQFLAADGAGHRLPALERRAREVFERAPVASPWGFDERKRILHGTIEPMLQREVQRRRLSPEGGFSSQLLGWVEVVA